MTRVNSDKDVQPNGHFQIYDLSEMMSSVYSSEGAFLRGMPTERTEMLLQAYRNPTNSQLGFFSQAVAVPYVIIAL